MHIRFVTICENYSPPRAIAVAKCDVSMREIGLLGPARAAY